MVKKAFTLTQIKPHGIIFYIPFLVASYSILTLDRFWSLIVLSKSLNPKISNNRAQVEKSWSFPPNTYPWLHDVFHQGQGKVVRKGHRTYIFWLSDRSLRLLSFGGCVRGVTLSAMKSWLFFKLILSGRKFVRTKSYLWKECLKMTSVEAQMNGWSTNADLTLHTQI